MQFCIILSSCKKPSPLSPNIFAGFFVIHSLLKTVYYLSVLGTLFIQGGSFTHTQYFLHLLQAHPKEKPDAYYMLLGRTSCSVKDLISIIPVEIQRADQVAALNSLILNNTLNITGELGKGLIRHDIRVEPFCSADILFDVFRFNSPLTFAPCKPILPVYSQRARFGKRAKQAAFFATITGKPFDRLPGQIVRRRRFHRCFPHGQSFHNDYRRYRRQYCRFRPFL